ncbi:MAG: ATP-binding cassette domain-containing protein [Chitinivibrionales bacterium]|nr:ATP-binding cassette domain-containing protein [Chitinivibrionales bacterium]
MNDLLLRVDRLKKTFPVKAGAFSNKKLMLKAVSDVSFELKRGEVLGLVGESGCGKTTLGRCIIRIYKPDSGRIFIEPNPEIVKQVTDLDDTIEKLTRTAGTDRRSQSALTKEIKQLKKKANGLAAGSDILSMNRQGLRQNRKKIQMVFQDPWASLNPRMLVKDIIGEGPLEYGMFKGKQLDDFVYSLIGKVGLPAVAGMRYPHEFSGGQRQRIGIARALALRPSLIICDEPVSALDVSIQAQILNLFIQLQEEFDLTYIFIAHNLSVVHYISDRIAVMYLGKIVEVAPSKLLHDTPKHPYTISLLSAVPVADPEIKIKDVIMEGDVASPVNPPSGCTFHPRCTHRTEICTTTAPHLVSDSHGHWLACHNPPIAHRSL